ncbi:MAG: hypothetical protein Q3979_05155 [Actinomycetaceae bacterium]|nr:hypothetical protein [Actinomycetaceae bacterium]
MGFPSSNGDTAPDESDNSNGPSSSVNPRALDDEDFQSISSRAKAAGARASRFVRSLANLPPDTDEGSHIGSQLSNIGEQAVAGQNAQANAASDNSTAAPSGQDGSPDADPSQSPALGPEAKTHEPAMRQSLQYGQNLYHGGHRAEQVSTTDDRLSDSGAQAQTMTLASLSLLVAGGGILVARRRGAHRA